MLATSADTTGQGIDSMMVSFLRKVSTATSPIRQSAYANLGSISPGSGRVVFCCWIPRAAVWPSASNLGPHKVQAKILLSSIISNIPIPDHP